MLDRDTVLIALCKHVRSILRRTAGQMTCVMLICESASMIHSMYCSLDDLQSYICFHNTRSNSVHERECRPSSVKRKNWRCWFSSLPEPYTLCTWLPCLGTGFL